MDAAEATYIETPRLALRPPQADDIAALVEGAGNYDVARWLGRVPYPYSESDADSFVAECEGQEGQVWLIFDDDGLVGGIGTDRELGYWICRPKWGQGYASEAATAVLAAYFSNPTVGEITSSHLLDNARSARLLRKLGFTDTGTATIASKALHQDVVVQEMILTRDTWKAAANDLSGVTFSATPPVEGTLS